MEALYDNYNYIFYEIADPRLKGWPLMESPVPVVGIVIFYLLSIKVLLPAYMKNRQPYDLKTVIRWYNVFQIITNSVCFYGILTSGWLTNISFIGCHLPNFDPNDRESMSMLKWMYLSMMFRLVDMVETSFFILRKKDSQASFLHIYHHCISFSVMWVGVKFIGGGSASIVMLLNNPVHAIMYSYYLISCEAGPKLRARLNRWKMWLTILQMIQFTVLCLHSLQALMPSCPAPPGIMLLYVPNVLVIYYLFYHFYRDTYSAASHQGAKKHNAVNNTNGHHTAAVNTKTDKVT